MPVFGKDHAQTKSQSPVLIPSKPLRLWRLQELGMNEAPNLFTDGKAYERLMGRWSQVAGAKFLDWLDAPKGLHWIDVGCGNGAFTEVLIARSAPAAVTGIDPSPGQIDYALTRPATKLAQFRLADAQALPFAENSFDAASMALVIAFVPDPVKAASEMARVVKPGGIVATYMWDFDGGRSPLEPLQAAMSSLNIPIMQRSSSQASQLNEMRAIWEKAGLQSLETQVIRIRIAYSDLDDFCDSNIVPIGPTGKILSELSPAARQKLKERLREILPIAADGRIAYDAFANAVKGRAP
jgi:ubiquinone/menaquinone biosynthesis C-methylase UbiE